MVRRLRGVLRRLWGVMCRLWALVRRLWGVVCRLQAMVRRLWGVSHSGRNQQKRVSPVGETLFCPAPLPCAEGDVRSIQESA